MSLIPEDHECPCPAASQLVIDNARPTVIGRPFIHAAPHSGPSACARDTETKRHSSAGVGWRRPAGERAGLVQCEQGH